MPMSILDSQVRVKVYQLGDNATWDDRGIGYCTLEDYQGEPHLNVVSESEPNRIILDSVVQKGEVYERQDATLIVWTEPTGEDLALSFHTLEGCTSILTQIKEFGNALKESSQDNSFAEQQPSTITLPSPTLANIGEIERVINSASKSILERDNLVTYLTNEPYLHKLQDILEQCEDLDATKELHILYNIAQRIVLLNDTSIFEQITQDDTIIGFVGMLEHDPVHPVERGTYRKFLQDRTRYKQAVVIDDQEIESKIHQTYRLQYLKDVVLTRILDEGTLPVIRGLILYNHAQIAGYLQNNDVLFKELFDTLHSISSSPEQKRNVVLFIYQFCALVKTLPIIYRGRLFHKLCQHGLLSVFGYALQDTSDQELQVKSAEILVSVLEQDRALVRSYILSHKSGEPDILALAIQGTKQRNTAEFGGIQLLCCEMLRMLLELLPPSPLLSNGIGVAVDGNNTDAIPLMEENGTEADPIPLANNEKSSTETAGSLGIQSDKEADVQKSSESGCRSTEEFLALFYDDSSHAQTLFEPLTTLSAKDPEKFSSVHGCTASSSPEPLVFLCEILSTMMRQHGYRARTFIMKSHAVRGIASLLSRSKHNHLKLAAIRFIRTCIGLQDDAYDKYLITNRFLDPVVQLFVDIHTRDNLLTSACRELFVFVAEHRSLELLTHFINVHGKALERVPAVLDTLRWAQNDYFEALELAKNGGSGMPTPTADAAWRSPLSTSSSMLVGNGDNNTPRRPLLSATTNGNFIVGRSWGSSMVDEIEDAFLESPDDCDDLSADVDENGMPQSAGSPELDALQDCLTRYPGNNDSLASVSDGMVGLFGRKDNPAGSPLIGELELSDDLDSVKPFRQESTPATLRRYSSANGRLLADPANKDDDKLSDKPGLAGSLASAKGHSLSMSDAFPDSRPVSSSRYVRRSTSNRFDLKKKPLGLIKPIARPLQTTSATINEDTNDTDLALGKRQREHRDSISSHDSKKPVCNSHPDPEVPKETRRQGCGTSTIEKEPTAVVTTSPPSRPPPGLTRKSSGLCFSPTMLEGSHLVVNKSNGQQSPPKKARTASM